jgi:alkanesulfonate monooxygenase SsuD/methylene tetrahydromethanopterin reductase-like flavin-dependent oxidoreductase (luciferase family)
VVAESADGWNTFFMPIEEYRRKLDILAAHCRAVGRDPKDIRKSLVIQMAVGRDAAEVETILDRLGRARGVAPEVLRTRAVIGTPEQCVEQLMPYVDAGVGDFIVGARPPADWTTLELVATEVAPAVKARAAGKA